MTGAYSLTMGGAAALGSALVVPVAMAGFGWRGALLLLMVFPATGAPQLAAAVPAPGGDAIDRLRRYAITGGSGGRRWPGR
ncbi:cyanate transporter [Klebsiella pneumoniae subsp. rhinoscleromatis]|nr:cyanate transporter [Klebsiella pneumoniae subsp. rhinoscleromatis]